MKTKLHSILILLLAIVTANTFGQIPNSGFENWTTVGSYMDPDGWKTNNSGATSFYTITRANDSYPTSVGIYSIRIESNPSLMSNPAEALGVTMSGTTISVPLPAFPITGHPTSLTGYYKFAPLNGDTMRISIILYNGGTAVSNGSFNSTSSVSSWTSFSIPLSSYATADSAHIILASYNCIAAPPQSVPYGNSVLYVDNLNFDNLITVGIADLNKTDYLSIYPNPFSTLTTLQIDNHLHNATLTVDNCFGQTVKEVKNISGQTVALSRDNLPSGLYFIRLTQDSKVITTNKILIAD
jgi:hypothetical protein